MEKTELCKIAEQYGTDKVPSRNHVYTPFYYELFKDRRNEVKKVLEIGVATQKQMKHIPHYQTGASLRMWRDFFPNAEVYGLDIDPEAMFEDNRIQTFLCDATDENAVGEVLRRIGSDIDLVIDDGSHRLADQIASVRIIRPFIKPEATYIIEDVSYTRRLRAELDKDYLMEEPDLPGRRELTRKKAKEFGVPAKYLDKLVVVSPKPTQYEVSQSMKNLLIYVSAEKQLRPEYEWLVKMQIENSLRLGWRPEDILFVTNFPYEYMGVKATISKLAEPCPVRPRSTNTIVIPALIDEGIIQDGFTYWNHDTDAFQVRPIDDKELGLENYDAGLTDYGWRSRLCMGSFFVKSSSREFFAKSVPIVLSDIEDEDAVQTVLNENPEMAKRVKMMNITYNIGMRRVDSNIAKATPEPRVFHFHPDRAGLIERFKPMMPLEMADIFTKYGF